MVSVSLNRWDFYTALGGNILEYYNVTLYGFIAAKIAPYFFPFSDYRLSILASFAAFAMGFVTRPLGGLIFGYMGDKIGSKSGLYYSLIFGSIPALLISILPTYNMAGILAPIGLIFCRMLQGVSIAGEWANIAVYILDKAPSNKMNFWGSILFASGFVGALLSSSVAIIVTDNSLPEWYWRLPFFAGGVISLINIIIRSRLLDNSPRQKEKYKNNTPIKSLFRSSKFKLLLTVFLAAVSSGTYYISSIYINALYTLELGFSVQDVCYINLLLMAFWLFLIPLFGKIGDRFGMITVIELSLCVIALVAYPAFILLELRQTWSFIAAQALLTLPNLGIAACTNAFLFSLFNKEHRCSALGIGFNIGTAVFAGTAPTIAFMLVEYTGDFKSPALYIIPLSLICVFLLRRIQPVLKIREVLSSGLSS